ncbi:MAG TPA: phosphoadenosine phosphosulfate reductase family protein [Niabella sp.]|nr:phosphoadenosine phosphosulfate reductase family protein [Niabella sp.]
MSQIITDAIEKYKPVKILLMFSGGHDSLCSTHYSAAFLQAIGQEFTVYHGNTGIGIRQTREYVYSVVNSFRWSFQEGYPRSGETYEDFVRQCGFPGPTRQMHQIMYNRLKERALRKYVTYSCKSTPHARENVLLITGIRKSESKIRMGYTHHTQKDGSRVWCNPIFHWSKRDCDVYMQRFQLPRNPVKDKICISGECLCGAFARKEEWAEIKASYPEAADEIERLHRIAIANGHPWPWASGPAMYYKHNPPGQMKMFMCVGCESKR